MVLVEKAILAVLALDAAVAVALPVVYYASLRADRSRNEHGAARGNAGRSADLLGGAYEDSGRHPPGREPVENGDGEQRLSTLTRQRANRRAGARHGPGDGTRRHDGRPTL